MIHNTLAGLACTALLVALPGGVAIAAAADDSGECQVTSWTMHWGVKESFRSYLSGAIAQGDWETSGNVSYTTPQFVIQGDSGWVSADGSEANLSTQGNIRFTGHDGLLDQSLSAPAIQLDNHEMSLVFDVVGDTQEQVSVNASAVPFAVGSVNPTIEQDRGRWVISDVPVTLTQEGAEAFGTYPEGELLDPVSLEVFVEPGCLRAEAQTGPSQLAWIAGLAILAATLGFVATWSARRLRGPGRQELPES